MDFFISGAFLEADPERAQRRYSERMVLLPGSGIHYERIPMPPAKMLCQCQARHGIPDPLACKAAGLAKAWVNDTTATVNNVDALRPLLATHIDPHTGKVTSFADATVVFGCPQSLYKLRPEYDHVLLRILTAVPNSVLVLVTERRELHTLQFKQRLQAAMQLYAADSAAVEALAARIIWVPRISGSDNYFAMFSCIDILLHPFPFDGSKTAADGIATGTPMVTLPTDDLRGRMGAALYRSLALDDLIATDVDDYIARAVRLATDWQYRVHVVRRLRQLRPFIFDRKDLVDAWAMFLLRTVAGDV